MNKDFNSLDFDVDSEALNDLRNLVYVCQQYAENMGRDLDAMLKEWHEKNASKLRSNH